MEKMVFLSVLLISLCLQLAYSRRLTDDIDNEVSTNTAGNLNSFSLRNQRNFVTISDPPIPVISRNVGSHVELSCQAMGSPPPTIQWYKRNMRITENESFEDFNMIDTTAGLARVASRLVINYVLPRHQDVYRCVAEAGNRVASAITELIIPNKEGREMNFTQLVASKILGAHHMPRVTFWAPAYMDIIGSDVILPCKSVGNPKPNLMWIDDKAKVITNDDKFTIHPDGELSIKSITWNEMGGYTCFVENSVGRDSVETFLYPMLESSK